MTPLIRLGLAEFAKDVHGFWRHQNTDQRRINVTEHLGFALDDIEFLRNRIVEINGPPHFEVPVSEHTTEQQLAALQEQVQRMVEDMATVGVTNRYKDRTPRDPVNSLKAVLSIIEQATLGVDARVHRAVEIEREAAREAGEQEARLRHVGLTPYGAAEFIEHAQALADLVDEMADELRALRDGPPVVALTLSPPPLPHDSRPSGDDDGTIVLGGGR